MQRTALALASSALLLAACGDTSAGVRPAATVNGVAIDTDDLDELTSAVLQVQLGADTSIPEDRVDGDLARSLVQTEVILEAVRQHVASEGFDQIEITDADATEVAQQITNGTLDDLSQGAGDGYVEKARAFLRFESGFYRQTFDAAPQDWARRCVSHLLVESEAEADAALTRIDDGEPFADVASDVSIDPGSAAAGGELRDAGGGCQTTDAITQSYVAPFAEAANAAVVGEPTAPFETEFGFHVVLVTEEQTDFDAASMRAELQQTDGFSNALFDVVRAADVEVASRYGTWIQSEAGIEPPGFQGLPAPAES
jgi:parvulin-like peptidyl-prolyl isomerase